MVVDQSADMKITEGLESGDEVGERTARHVFVLEDLGVAILDHRGRPWTGGEIGQALGFDQSDDPVVVDNAQSAGPDCSQ